MSEQDLREILAQLSGRSAESIDRGQHLMVDLGLDSPKALELMMDLEDRLGVEISDEQAARWQTVGDLMDFVDAQG